MLDTIIWLLKNLAFGVVNFFRLFFDPSFWPNFSDKEWLIRFIYYGGSKEFLFVVIDLAIAILIAGLFYRKFLWRVVTSIESVCNFVGRIAAWAALIMVLQQVMIVALQRVFRVSEITVGPFGYVFSRDLSWFGEELKLYNAILVTLAAAYTFVQGGHVRVDLFYAGVSFRAKRVIDMFGSLFFVLPFMTVVWFFGWFFMWRSLVTPKVAAANTLDLLLRKVRVLKWNVETIGFSPNGFDGYFLFKVLLVSFAGLMFLQGLAFFYRSLLEYLEGPESENKLKDLDNPDSLDVTTSEAESQPAPAVPAAASS